MAVSVSSHTVSAVFVPSRMASAQSYTGVWMLGDMYIERMCPVVLDPVWSLRIGRFRGGSANKLLRTADSAGIIACPVCFGRTYKWVVLAQRWVHQGPELRSPFVRTLVSAKDAHDTVLTCSENEGLVGRLDRKIQEHRVRKRGLYSQRRGLGYGLSCCSELLVPYALSSGSWLAICGPSPVGP